ncbi:signal transduction histidine kinase [Arthrobacter stackebrandtii]|uniref:histidine kinase n=1 Tax=Arthrobacter stackebrandtii TaxID=272161 RepID=A0ABS4YYS4_9MICC|nr:HAMP domain-containing sensor histidine kinase [Arthrobacter stackebrandtii]MBP2413947.1 signal transduction histidine kinase [Arthrobacter stackebrandtii]PYH00550.1 two-component sensor histidine kinase [Arthrobacter stackebrandtii]
MTDSPRRHLTARGRIIGAMVLLLAVAFAGSIVLSAQILNARTDAMVDDRLTHAATSFRTFATSPSGSSQFTADALLTRFLQDTVPTRAETAFSLLDGVPHRRMAGDPPARLDRDPAFLALVTGHEQPVHGRYATSAGPVAYAVIPVQVVGDSASGALVSVQFRREVAAPLFSSLGIFALAGVLAVIGAGIASWLIAGRVLAPLRQVRETAETISETDLKGRIEVKGHDDVAALATTFNRMLDRLETAFATQQQFVDDAGHELRTPITVVRGHLEMMSEDPAERAETIALVTDELDRMARIVNDLLLLAKSQQPDFVVPQEVELMELMVDALSKASMLGPQNWTLDELAEGHIAADGQRLTQALMQLASNAVNHTPPGGTIALGSTYDDGTLLLWVRDTGAGIAEEDQAGIFSRFHRGPNSGHSAGAGLGLSIVKSIAEGHGGSVTVASSLGAGSIFTMLLPVSLLPDDESNAGGAGPGSHEKGHA